MSDKELIKIIMQSDENGFLRLLDEYGNYVKTIVAGVLRKKGNHHDIEECVTDVLVDIVLKKDKLDIERSTLKSYIGTAARNRAVDVYRKITGQERYIYDEETDEAFEKISDRKTPETIVCRREMNNILWESVSKLGEPDSEIIMGQFYAGKSMKMIASELSMSLMTVYKRSIRARKKLVKILENRFEREKISKEDIYETT